VDGASAVGGNRSSAGHRLADAVAEGLISARADENVDGMVEGLDRLQVAKPAQPPPESGFADLPENLVAIVFVARRCVPGKDPDHALILAAETLDQGDEIFDTLTWP